MVAPVTKFEAVLNDQSPDTHTGGVHVNNEDLNVDSVTQETRSGSQTKIILAHSTSTRVVCKTSAEDSGLRAVNMKKPCFSSSRKRVTDVRKKSIADG